MDAWQRQVSEGHSRRQSSISTIVAEDESIESPHTSQFELTFLNSLDNMSTAIGGIHKGRYHMYSTDELEHLHKHDNSVEHGDYHTRHSYTLPTSLRSLSPVTYSTRPFSLKEHELRPTSPISLMTPTTLVNEEEAKPQPLVPVGFWDHSLARTRKSVLLQYSKTLFILCVSIMGILSIYWGVLFDVKTSLSHAKVAIVDFEGLAPYENTAPIVGPFIRAAVEAEVSSRPDHLGFQYLSPSQYGNDPMNVRLAVYEEEIWAAIIINANATALLQQAIQTGNTSYDPYGAATIVYNQARDIESYNFYIVPVLDRLAQTITTTFATSWASQVLADSTLDASVYRRAPQALSPGISFTILNLRPFDPPTAIPSITIGLIYLIIIAFFSFTFFTPTHMRFVLPNATIGPHPPLRFKQLVLYRFLATLTTYFFLSLAYSLVSLAFRIPFSNSPADGGAWSKTEPVIGANPYGHATWVVYWMLNWAGITALGLPLECAAMFLSTVSALPYSALFLIFWVITNVSTGFYALELASGFYGWGWGWPLRHVVSGSKALVLGTKSELGLNFGVLFAWAVGASLVFPVACWFVRWKAGRRARKTSRVGR